MERNEDLERAIANAPDDFSSYVVYADWLLEQGNPRGELIGLQRLNKKRESEALLQKHAADLLGPLSNFPEAITNVLWHMGFVRACRVATAEDQDGEEALRALSGHPSFTFLRKLTVGILDVEGNDYSLLWRELAEHPKPILEELYVGDFSSEETELNWSSIGTTTAAWAEGVLPRISALTLRSGSMDLRGVRAPSLKELYIVTGGFDSASLDALLSVEWPNLHTLSLQLGSENEIDVRELDRLFEGASFPALRHLGLTNSTISDEIAKQITESPIVKQLETLDLSLGTLGDEGAQAIIDAKARLAHLKRIDLSENWISRAMSSRLTGICEALFDADQQDDRGDRQNRYIAAYE